jgi:hypothetical protein
VVQELFGSVDIVQAEYAQVEACREVLAQQAVGVSVRATQPWPCGMREVDVLREVLGEPVGRRAPSVSPYPTSA